MPWRGHKENQSPIFRRYWSVQKDNVTGDTIAGVQVGIPLPIWNRNQGEIMQAQAEISQARRNVDRVQLNLKNRLAVAFQRYSSAQERARIYSTVIIPKAEENFKLVQGAFPAQIGSLEYLDGSANVFPNQAGLYRCAGRTLGQLERNRGTVVDQ